VTGAGEEGRGPAGGVGRQIPPGRSHAKGRDIAAPPGKMSPSDGPKPAVDPAREAMEGRVERGRRHATH